MKASPKVVWKISCGNSNSKRHTGTDNSKATEPNEGEVACLLVLNQCCEVIQRDDIDVRKWCLP